MPVAVALGYGEEFGLARVPLLALDVAICRLRKHRRRTGQQPVAGINLVCCFTGNHKEGDAVAYLADPVRLLVKTWLECRLRWVIPHQAVTLVGDDERHTGRRSRRRQIVVPAAHGMTAMIEETLLVVTQTVVMLVIGRDE